MEEEIFIRRRGAKSPEESDGSKETEKKDKPKRVRRNLRRKPKKGDSGSGQSTKSTISNAVVKIDENIDEDTESGYDFPYPEGWLKVIMDYTAQCSVTSHKMYNLAGAISILGHVAGQRIMGPTGVRTNFYNVVLGYAGSGKEAPLSAAKNLLNPISNFWDINQYGAIDTVTSEAAVLTTMKNLGPIMFLCIDEMGDVFSQAKNRGSNAYKIMTLFKQLFSKTNSSFSKQYAQQRDCFDIMGPHLTVLGVSTPDELLSAFGSNHISSGLLPRCLFFPSHHPPQDPNFNVSLKGTDEIVENLRIITNIGTGNDPLMVPESTQAKVIRKEWQAHCTTKVTACYKDKVMGAIYGRRGEHGLKLSLLHSISRWDTTKPEDIRIEAVDCNWGFGLAEGSVGWLVNSASSFTGGSDKHQQNVHKVYTVISEYQEVNGEPCLSRHVQQKLHMKVPELDSVIATLVAAEQVSVKEISHKNNTVTRLYSIIG